MKSLGVVVAFLAMAVATGFVVAADRGDEVPLYTSDDLDRMFGPAPTQPSEPVDKTTPDDWSWVERFIDRQYERVDADRRYDLERRTLDVAEGRTVTGYRGGYAAWSLGYPASTWWNNVWWRYAAATSGGYRAPVARPSASVRGGFRGHAGGHGPRSK